MSEVQVVEVPASFTYSPWRHGGWYVHEVRYPSGAIGCVSHNYPDGKWRIVCDPREFDQAPTFNSRDEAASAEFLLAAKECEHLALLPRTGPASPEAVAASDAGEGETRTVTTSLPLTKLETMVALCREARIDLLSDIDSNVALRRDRWRVDRSPCLYALDANGERLNDGHWCAWRRRKSDVEALLQRYPTTHEIIVDGGIDVAANKEAYEASNYEPFFWQATIWKRDAPVFSLEDIDAIVRRRTAFAGINALLRAKGNYRPSLDMRDPEMAALAEFYDSAMAKRGDERRAYRYGLPADAAAPNLQDAIADPCDPEQAIEDEPEGMRP